MKLGKRSNAHGSDRHGRERKRLSALVAALVIPALLAPGRGSAAEVRVASSILSPLRTSEAPAAESGVLITMAVTEGEVVHAGQMIGRVDTRRQELLARIAEQDLAIARREAQSDVRIRLATKVQSVAEAELVRATSVNAEFPNTVSQTEVERLRLSAQQAELEIENARFERSLLGLRIARIESDLRRAQHEVERMKIAAPIGGVVAEVHKRAGEWVDQGDPVLRIVRVDRLKLEGYVPVTEAAGLVGRPVRVEVRFPTGESIPASGRVVFVSPEAEPVNAQVLFRAEIDNARGRLRPGLTASLVVIGERDASADLTRRDSQPKRVAQE